MLGKVQVSPRLDLIRQSSGKGLLGAVSAIAESTLETWSASDTLRKELEATMRAEIANSPFAKYAPDDPIYVIDLSGTFSVKDKSERKQEEIQKEGKVVGTKTYYQVTRAHDLKLRYEITVTGTGRVIGGRSQSTSKTLTGRGDSAEEAAKDLTEWSEVGKGMIVDLVPEIMEEILPHYVAVTLKLRKGKHPTLKEAAKAASKGNFEGAATLWQEILSKAEGLTPGDLSAAHHNLGVYYESRDDLARAKESFAACLAASPDDWCTEGISRLSARAHDLMMLEKGGHEEKSEE